MVELLSLEKVASLASVGEVRYFLFIALVSTSYEFFTDGRSGLHCVVTVVWVSSHYTVVAYLCVDCRKITPCSCGMCRSLVLMRFDI